MSDRALAETRAWVERAVIGLQLCPFAKAPQVKGQVRYVASEAVDAERQSLVARDALVLAQVGQATALVSIYRALGGGWSEAPAAVAAK